MRKLRFGCWAALVVAGAAAPARADSSPHSLTPQHARQLQQEIQQCASRVNTASSPEERCQQQEELCKKLLQAEDYDNALKVATTVYSTGGVNPERRAAHHFLIAQIHAMRMEASSTLSEMERNRQKAYATAQEVLAQKYPEQWGVGSAATGLMQELQNQQKQQLTRAKVAKRESGRDAMGIARFAEAQSNNMKNSVAKKNNALLARSSGGGFLNKGANSTTMVSSEPARSALAARLARSSNQGIRINDSTGKVSASDAKVSYSASGARISDSKGARQTTGLVRGSGKLRSGVIINSSGVYLAPRSSSDSPTAAVAKPVQKSGIGSPAASSEKASAQKSSTKKKGTS